MKRMLACLMTGNGLLFASAGVCRLWLKIEPRGRLLYPPGTWATDWTAVVNQHHDSSNI
jgi:hypothetical protein